MTLQEFNDEFQFKYDAASNGGPDLNSYEKSLCLTQATRDIIEDAYATFETNEKSRRILAPLLDQFESNVVPVVDNYNEPFLVYNVTLPPNLNYILREEAILDNCSHNPTIVKADLDYLSEYLKNPYKKPNQRKIIRTEYGSVLRAYTTIRLLKYRIKYLKKYSPIILTDFELDPELLGTETIEGLNTQTTTELPYFVHDEIVDKAVIIAIKITRENSLQTQVQIP